MRGRWDDGAGKVARGRGRLGSPHSLKYPPSIMCPTQRPLHPPLASPAPTHPPQTCERHITAASPAAAHPPPTPPLASPAPTPLHPATHPR